ncbi:hypothetical protein CRG98_006151 [Punica granatum]|uniref:Uncharacterized protein n=1 Tax=Punica granatum TaxID=22663 RepID=A0A2I0KYL4_PUNGR|nr:hypothetical protein CRG98_006151 [Punica granatum]
MASGDSFSRAPVARPWEGGHSQAALHRRAHASPDEIKIRVRTAWRLRWGHLEVARWNPGGPMITVCSGIVGVPLLSHLGSTLIFLGRVIKQLGGLQDIPAEADRLPYRIQWADTTSTASARDLQIREIHRQRDTSTIQRLYFPEHPTDKERALSATSAYVAQFYSQGSMSPQREERDILRCELVDSRAKVADYRELQTKLARACARIATLDREMARLSATLDRVRARSRGIPHP